MTDKPNPYPILNRVGDHRVFSVEKLPDGRFELIELCDMNYGTDLTADELAALGRELIELSKT